MKMEALDPTSVAACFMVDDDDDDLLNFSLEDEHDDKTLTTLTNDPLSFSSSSSVNHPVGSKFGESTLKLGSILTDGQVGRFGDILPVQASGFHSFFTAARSE